MKKIKKYNEKDKNNILSLHSQGYKISELCENFNIGKSTIYNWVNENKVIFDKKVMNLQLEKYLN